MRGESQDHSKARLVEKILVVLAALACLVVTVWVWQIVSPNQSMWPIPGLYLIELVVLSILAAAAILIGHPIPAILPAIAFGVLLAFSFLAALSVGLFYAPVVLLLLIAGLLFFISTKRSLLVYLAGALAAAIIQVAIIIVVVRIL
jgi:hypothetical protein